jgi:hypothetical protein
MTLDLADVVLSGSAITPAFLHDGLASALDRQGLLAVTTGPEWDALRRSGHQQTVVRLAAALGYRRPLRQDAVVTRDGAEDGGSLLPGTGEARLRAWTVPSGLDLDAPSRDSPTRIAQRVLLARGEPAGLLTNGASLRLLLRDPLRADSSLTFPLDLWRDSAVPPDSYRLLLALASARALPHLPAVLEAARLHQAGVTTALRRQAQAAITGFINALPELSGCDAAALWRDALVLIYRLLFILKLESPGEAGGFSFASTRLWRTVLSPNHVLGPIVRRHLDRGADTGHLLETGLRLLFQLFRDGLSCSELRIAPLGGALFGVDAAPLLDRLAWGDRAVAILLDRLLWLPGSFGQKQRVHYGALDVETLGSVYEGLLEQEPGLAAEPMIRLRRGKQEAIVPAAGAPADIPPGRFFLRAGQGRKASGSFYTPHEFVHFLVWETLAPKIAALSPPDDPWPAALLRLKIVDPAAGSGHFLVEACRYLGDALLTACRQCDEQGLHDRIAALPDPDNTIAAYLPSRGYAEARARAICRRLVAVHCLYGCDRNQLAVELAKLSLWLESYAEGLPLTFLDHRIVCGDALSGPSFDWLMTLPVTGGPLDPLLAQGVTERLRTARDRALRLVRNLDASIGRDLDDLDSKQAVRQQLDATLHPLRRLAQAWAGAAMLRRRDGDDIWLGLAAEVAETGTWPQALPPRQTALMVAGAEALPWDLTFPEIFPTGFSAVLGNPPWDVVLHNTKDFLAAYDPAVLDAPTRTARAAIEQRLLAQPAVASAFESYRSGFERTKAVANRHYRHQRVSLGTDSTAGNLDLFRLFAERAMQLTAADGSIGLLLPASFHANEGTTGLRLLYLDQTNVTWCLSFENRRRLFHVHTRLKFDLLVAHRPGPTASLRCGFYLDRIEDATDAARIMDYSREFLAAAGGSSLTPLELRGAVDLAIAQRFFAAPERLRDWCARHRIRLGRDLHMTDDSGSFRPAGTGGLPVHEGKTFYQYTDSWLAKPRYAVPADSLRPPIAEAARFYRLAIRDIARSTDERTMIACVAPPGVVFGHTATVEKAPWARTNADALVLCALFNSFCFDWLVRQKAATHLSLYILNALPVPPLTEAQRRFLAHAALRLSGSHVGYDALWLEQIGERRPDLPAHWPDAHWPIRAAIDAVVARAYGLRRVDYAHLLGSFQHRSFPDASGLCLAAFDALTAENAAAFFARHDPWFGQPCASLVIG